MSKVVKAVFTKNAPSPRAGIYNQAIIANGFIYTSGFTPVDPKVGKLVEGTVADRALQCLRNIGAVLDASGSSINHAVKVTVYLTSMNDFDIVNKVYSEFWGEVKPARACVAVKELPRGTDVEMDCVAMVSD
ncbi:hypothetical protein V2G26_010353 [Clonostachys chloroleuca]|uniref:Uncharacterized protein n=1 Tax=Clonostachys chloroleuca TaxID=1926264 RepID=A0AA35LU91_9HYPO|nr:unnamed protein product [Clonostachys chloroleuca]